jgi:DNA topoisomerase-1
MLQVPETLQQVQLPRDAIGVPRREVRGCGGVLPPDWEKACKDSGGATAKRAARGLRLSPQMIAKNDIAWARLDEAPVPEKLARAARLRYVSDDEPGFSRRKNGRGFVYVDEAGRKLRRMRHLQRIHELVIPPAWTDVWICRDEHGHLQVTGRDDQERKQYIYHERWREASNLAKFRRMLRFGTMLPEIRQKVSRQLRQRGDSREKVCSLLLALLDHTSIRVGNEEYVQENGSYGLTTLRRRHITADGAKVCFRFRSKSGKKHCVELNDARLSRLVLRSRDLPGQHLFTYQTASGEYVPATSDDVNAYLRELTGESFTAKDFRTWKASAVAAGMLFDQPDVPSISQRKKIITSVVKHTADVLGNTATVCRKYYIHPLLLESYLEGNLADHFQDFRPRRKKWLSRDEQLLIRFLETIP